VPAYEVPRTTAATADDADVDPAFARMDGLCRDMRDLAGDIPATELAAKLRPLTTAYGAWIDSQEARIADPASGLAEHRVAATLVLARCREALARIEAGIELLTTDPQAAEAFRFMNRAMWLQRTHTILAEHVRRDQELDFAKDIDRPEN